MKISQRQQVTLRMRVRWNEATSTFAIRSVRWVALASPVLIDTPGTKRSEGFQSQGSLCCWTSLAAKRDTRILSDRQRPTKDTLERGRAPTVLTTLNKDFEKWRKCRHCKFVSDVFRWNFNNAYGSIIINPYEAESYKNMK